MTCPHTADLRGTPCVTCSGVAVTRVASYADPAIERMWSAKPRRALNNVMDQRVLNAAHMRIAKLVFYAAWDAQEAGLR
jgi:hypothetical protein